MMSRTPTKKYEHMVLETEETMREKNFKKRMADDEPCVCQCGGDVPEDFYWPGMDKILLEYRERIKKQKLIEDARA